MASSKSREFAGSGQWMNGGMSDAGDMFNQGLKASVLMGSPRDWPAAARQPAPDLFQRELQSQKPRAGGRPPADAIGGRVAMQTGHGCSR